MNLRGGGGGYGGYSSKLQEFSAPDSAYSALTFWQWKYARIAKTFKVT